MTQPLFDLPDSVKAAMARAKAAGPLTPAEQYVLENLHPRRIDQAELTLCAECGGEYPDTSLDGGVCHPCRVADERLTLAHESTKALEFADELETVAASLRAVVAGTASRLEISDVVGSIDGWGKLVVESTLDWRLLIRHGRAPAEAGR